jgi:hypothetical protein
MAAGRRHRNGDRRQINAGSAAAAEFPTSSGLESNESLSEN